MIIKFVLFVAVSRYILGRDIAITTVNTGDRNSFNTPNIVDFYTAISTYEIIPTDDKYLSFDVKACHNAFILFSESNNISVAKQFYEIVIGGFINQRDLIRRRYRNGKDQPLVQKLTKSLSCHEYRSFLINWTIDGNVQLRRDSGLVLNMSDPDPIPVNAFGIRTGFGRTGSWIFHMKANKSSCQCSCAIKATRNITNRSNDKLMEILSPKLEAIKRELTVNKYNLSTNIRKRTSASDSRKSAQNIGIVGFIFLCLVIGLIIMVDVTSVLRSHSSPKIKPTR